MVQLPGHGAHFAPLLSMGVSREGAGPGDVTMAVPPRLLENASSPPAGKLAGFDRERRVWPCSGRDWRWPQAAGLNRSAALAVRK